MIRDVSSDFLDAVILEVSVVQEPTYVSVVRCVEGALSTYVAASTITAMRALRDRRFPVGS